MAKSCSVKMIGFEEVMNSPGKVLGRGNFGTTYRAVLGTWNGFVVAAKMLRDDCVHENEFRERVERMGKMIHENLLPLTAYSHGMNRWLLLFEYMPNGSVCDHLHGNEDADINPLPLSWEVRSRIAYKVARAIEYLHSQGPDFCHGNLKSSNIFLTRIYEAKVSEYGIGHLISPVTKAYHIWGCSAPEMKNARDISQKTDVYSFGVLLLELLSGLAPLFALMNKKGVDLPKWVRSIVTDKPSFVVFDQRLPKSKLVEDQMVQMLQLGIYCTFQSPNKRPSMKILAEKIKDICQFTS
ncbi:probable inactive receptor kinase At1g48480 [Impatiens glandulifera]|uniref:probable inactive receptor kinase At1g48480 n=1 Tax=Impatiens glandulifera TaxID=253017 RepID=UPI001FB0E4BF|nr:probable inactive receptor kinase At1g48480 [Impatiens glandulifera]